MSNGNDQFSPILLILDQGSYLLLAQDKGENDYCFFCADGTPVAIEGGVAIARSITHPAYKFVTAVGTVDVSTEVQTINGRQVSDVWNSFEEFDISFAADGSSVTVVRK